MTPNDSTGKASAAHGEPICACGATTRSAKSADRCANGHLLRGNRAAAITGHHGANFRREHGAEIEDKADRFARDAGYSSLKAAPLSFQIAAIALARTATVGDLAYWKMLEAGGPMSESGKPRRAYSIWADTNRDLARDLKGAMAEVIAARPPEDSQRNQYSDLSLQELFDLSVKFAEELNELMAQSAVLNDQSEAHLASLHTRPTPAPALSRTDPPASAPSAPLPLPRASRSPSASEEPESGEGVSQGSPPPAHPATRDTAEPGASEPRPALFSDGRPRPTSQPDSNAPDVWAYGRRVTESDVAACMADSGDKEAYRMGRISTREAYERTRIWLRNIKEMR